MQRKDMAALAVLLRFAGKHSRIRAGMANSLGFGWHTITTYARGYKVKGVILEAAIPRYAHSSCFFLAFVRNKRERRVWVADDAGFAIRTISIHHGVQRTVANRYYRREFAEAENYLTFRATTYRAPAPLAAASLYPQPAK